MIYDVVVDDDISIIARIVSALTGRCGVSSRAVYFNSITLDVVTRTAAPNSRASWSPDGERGSVRQHGREDRSRTRCNI